MLLNTYDNSKICNALKKIEISKVVNRLVIYLIAVGTKSDGG